MLRYNSSRAHEDVSTGLLLFKAASYQAADEHHRPDPPRWMMQRLQSALPDHWQQTLQYFPLDLFHQRCEGKS